MTPEAKTKAAIKKVLETAGIYFVMPMGTGYGKSGVADFVACHNGKFLAIEAKAGKGRTTALQDRELQRVRDAGGVALVVSDKPEDFVLLGDTIETMKDKSK
jgi:Holliday junction resolvase